MAKVKVGGKTFKEGHTLTREDIEALEADPGAVVSRRASAAASWIGPVAATGALLGLGLLGSEIDVALRQGDTEARLRWRR